MYNVPIVTGASRKTDRNTGRLFIIVKNEALYYGKKLGRSLINPNQVRSYGTIVWYNPFGLKKELFVENEDGNMIYLTANGTNIGFNSRAPTEYEF